MTGDYLALNQEAVRTVSFDVVFNLHRDYVYGLVHTLLGNTQDAEDVTQEVFLRVYKSLHSYDSERAAIRTWLTRVAVNACHTHKRRNFLRNLWQRIPDGNDEGQEFIDPSPWGAPEDHALQNEMRRIVRETLSNLRLEHRTVLVLHYYLDLSCPEIAGILECPEGTIYSRLHYARRMVQAQLEGAHRS
jgi:RNA polymerase sigma-70 factor (ECF subfamily)